MSSTATDLKGKGKAEGLSEAAVVEPSDGSDSDSSGNDTSSDLDSDPGVSDSESITQEYLDSLLSKAKIGMANKKQKSKDMAWNVGEEEEILLVGEEEHQRPLPPLDPGPSLPRPYMNFGASKTEASSLLHDLEAEGVQQSAPSQPLAPRPSLELNKDGKPMTKRQKKEEKAAASSNWFDLPTPAAADLPKLYREVEALRLRKSLDPKRFYRKEEGEAKGIKGLPKQFAIGTILPSATPFGTPSTDNLPRAHRKRTIVDELVDDAEAKRYAKKKFLDLQGVRGERGRGTYARKKAGRRGKW